MTLKSTGYQVAESSVPFNGTQTLASLAADEYTDLSDERSNDTDKYVYKDLRLDLASLAVTDDPGYVSLYIVPSLDGGTTYPDWTGNSTADEPENEAYHVDTFVIKTGTAVKDAMIRNVLTPPGKYKYGIRNETGVSFAASGNALYERPHSFEDV
jgi:hypothetical protein